MTDEPRRGGHHDDHAPTDEAGSASTAYWRAVCEAMPPMTSQEIAEIATLLRRIDARHGNAE